jgi:adenine-specific DNA-methyltransferase
MHRKPPLTPQVTTLWDYPSQHYGETEQGSQSYRGATPSYVIWNVLHRFSKAGDVVLDPFCGSGTTLDVCRDLERRGVGFDLNPQRPDIGRADARSLPLKAKSVDLVFMDPPYADNLDYSDDARCIGKLPPNGRYQRAMRLVLAESARVLRDDGVLAIYVCDIFRKDKGFFPLGVTLFELAREAFIPLDIVAVTRHNRTLGQGNYRKAADEQGFFLRGFNWLLLLRKRRANEARLTEDDLELDLEATDSEATNAPTGPTRPTQRAPRPRQGQARLHLEANRHADHDTLPEPRATPRPSPRKALTEGPGRTPAAAPPPTGRTPRAPMPQTVRTPRVGGPARDAPPPAPRPASGSSPRPGARSDDRAVAPSGARGGADEQPRGRTDTTRRAGGPAVQKRRR